MAPTVPPSSDSRELRRTLASSADRRFGAADRCAVAGSGAVEAQIQELEARQQEIGLALADPDLYRDGQKARDIAQSRKETEDRVAWLMKEWEELSLRLSTVAGEER